MGLGARAGLLCAAMAAAACLSAPPGSGEPIDCPTPASEAPDPLIGNVLTYTFDDDHTDTEVIHDRSGNRLDGALEAGVITSGGRYGLNLESVAGPGGIVEVPANPLLHLGSALTLEMWVWRGIAGVDNDHGLLSVYDPAAGIGELILEIVDDGLWFGVASGDCDELVMTAVQVPSATFLVEANTWVHVAVTWNGEQVRFYRNGVLAADLPLAAEPCPLERPLYIGATGDVLLPYVGWLDDVKISDYVKSEEEIGASMMHDPTTAGPLCGNQLVEAGEDCEPPALCCDPVTCRYAATSCDCPAGCTAGLCAVGGAGRPESGLIALYEFEEGSGAIAADSSGTGIHLDLVGTSFQWRPGSLALTGFDTAAVSSSAASALTDACKASGEMTLEMWFTPQDVFDAQQIVAMLGRGDDCRAFALLQDQGRITAAIDSDVTEPDGEPFLDTPPSALAPRVTHAVLTRSADGRRRLYVDGLLLSESRVEGDFSTWDPAQRLTLGGPYLGTSPECESGGASFWQGELHRVAIYARALGVGEVAASYAAGPEVEPTTP